MAQKKTIGFFMNVIFITLLVDLAMIFFLPAELVIYLSVAVISLSLLVFVYLTNKTLFMMIVFILFFLFLYALWRTDTYALLRALTQRAQTMNLTV
jgi:hypothetical protein